MNKTIKIPHDGGLSALNKGAPENNCLAPLVDERLLMKEKNCFWLFVKYPGLIVTIHM
jgi:hypothetical protein